VTIAGKTDPSRCAARSRIAPGSGPASVCSRRRVAGDDRLHGSRVGQRLQRAETLGQEGAVGGQGHFRAFGERGEPLGRRPLQQAQLLDQHRRRRRVTARRRDILERLEGVGQITALGLAQRVSRFVAPALGRQRLGLGQQALDPSHERHGLRRQAVHSSLYRFARSMFLRPEPDFQGCLT